MSCNLLFFLSVFVDEHDEHTVLVLHGFVSLKEVSVVELALLLVAVVLVVFHSHDAVSVRLTFLIDITAVDVIFVNQTFFICIRILLANVL